MSAHRIIEVGSMTAVGPRRVTMTVNDETVWFESDDVDLTPSGHVSAAAGLMVAGLLDRQVVFDDVVDPRFALGMRLLDRTIAGWWNHRIPYEALRIERSPGRWGRRSERTALCFTGGVDSFHALRSQATEIDTLLFVRGYDIEVDDHARADAAEAMVRDVAAARGLDVIVVATNLRTIEPYRSTDWGQTHGAALAAVAHLLVDTIGRLVIGSSYATTADRPWGSHWRTDHRWGSRRLRIEHVDHRSTRAEKIQRIIDDPLARQHLLVCWQRRGAPGNCRECPKCVMTMAMIQHFGVLEDFTTLQPRGRLEERFAELGPDSLYIPSLEMIAGGTSPLAALALQRIAASPPAPAPTSRARRTADRLRLP